jgi:hypothetical protein
MAKAASSPGQAGFSSYKYFGSVVTTPQAMLYNGSDIEAEWVYKAVLRSKNEKRICVGSEP